MARHNRTGRSKTSARFVMLEEYLLRSVAWKEASLLARCALVELMRRYNGSNNGYIHLSTRELGPLLGKSHAHAARALIELEDLGFIHCQRLGSFATRNRKASEYLLAMFKNDVTGHRPSRQFMQYVARSLSHQRDNTGTPVRHKKDSCALRSHQRDRQSKNKPVHCHTSETHLDINHSLTNIDDAPTHARDELAGAVR